ncbi:MAG: phosphonate ABC transporter, permease protein PhnE [Acidimicrobiia bacterium]
MTAEATALRPAPPATAGRYFLPLAVAVALTGTAGLVVGDIAILWGAAIGLIAAAALWWLDLTRSPLLAASGTVAGAIAGAWVGGVLDQRSGPIDLRLSLAAGAGFAAVGLVVGLVLVAQRGGPYHYGTAVTGALAWGVAGTMALLWGTQMGYLDTLKPAAVEAGEIQGLDATFFFWVGVIVVAVGLGANLSLWVGSPALAGTAAAIVFTVFCANLIGFSVRDLFTEITELGDLENDFNFWPPQFSWPRFKGADSELQWLTPMIETLQIGVFGATIGCSVALPLAFLASRPTTYNSGAFWLARFFMNVVRTIPDLFWAIFFATAVGFGSPFAGALAMVMFSLAIMAKLLSETVDTIRPGPLEAARAAGSRHSQMVHYAAFPQVAPNYVAYALYIFELNIRASVVIGIVGAGGIGRLLDEQRNFFQWDRVLAIVIVIFVAVVIIETASVVVRRRLV